MVMTKEAPERVATAPPADGLVLAEDLTLPLQAVTETFGILGQRGSGKSNTAVRLAEEMYRCGLHWVAIDPKGDWWGLRSAGDGTKDGLPIPIFGGQHGDVRLEPESGKLIADLVVDETLTCVLDLSEFTEGEKIRFMAGHGREPGFASELLRRKRPEQAPTHVFFEEADDMLPQQGLHEKGKLLHDCSRLALWGRNRGVGVTVVTQRSARIHKDVLTQIGTLIALRTTSPQDRDAIEAWVKAHGKGKELIESLPGLPSGTGWVWSPEWLDVMQQVTFLRRSTFDSGATPQVGGGTRRPATLASIDLPLLREKIRAVGANDGDAPSGYVTRAVYDVAEISRTQAWDKLAALGKQVEEREREVRSLQAELIDADAKIAELERALQEKPQEIYVPTPMVPAGVRDLLKRMRRFERDLGLVTSALDQAFDGLDDVPEAVPSEAVLPEPVASAVDLETDELKAGARRLLDLLTWRYPLPTTRTQLAILAKHSLKSGTFDAYLRVLKAKRLVVEEQRELFAARELMGNGPAGGLGPPWEMRYGAWARCLKAGERRMLDVVLGAHGGGLTRESLAKASGITATGGTFSNYLGTLQRALLVTWDKESGSFAPGREVLLQPGRR